MFSAKKQVKLKHASVSQGMVQAELHHHSSHGPGGSGQHVEDAFWTTQSKANSSPTPWWQIKLTHTPVFVSSSLLLFACEAISRKWKIPSAHLIHFHPFLPVRRGSARSYQCHNLSLCADRDKYKMVIWLNLRLKDRNYWSVGDVSHWEKHAFNRAVNMCDSKLSPLWFM